MKETIKENYRKLLSLDDSPQMISISFAIGVFITISPFYGLHTILAILFIIIFRLNKIAIMSGAMINLPWISPLIYFPCYLIGSKIWKILPSLDKYELYSLDQFKVFFTSWNGFKTLLDASHFMRIFLPTLLGTTIVGIIASTTSFFMLQYIIKRRRINKKNLSEKSFNETK